jgi:carbonic anhydrase/acetyltransferase-like protein (isoleucine patch superfamily)
MCARSELFVVFFVVFFSSSSSPASVSASSLQRWHGAVVSCDAFVPDIGPACLRACVAVRFVSSLSFSACLSGTLVQPGNPIVIGSGNIVEERAYITSACVRWIGPIVARCDGSSHTWRSRRRVPCCSNGPVTIGNSNHLQVGCRLESCTVGDGNVVEANSSLGSGCTLENACVVGALVKLPEGESLVSRTVVFGSNNSSHVLPRPEGEVRTCVLSHPRAATPQLGFCAR